MARLTGTRTPRLQWLGLERSAPLWPWVGRASTEASPWTAVRAWLRPPTQALDRCARMASTPNCFLKVCVGLKPCWVDLKSFAPLWPRVGRAGQALCPRAGWAEG
jgi:hypothetical protein